MATFIHKTNTIYLVILMLLTAVVLISGCTTAPQSTSGVAANETPISDPHIEKALLGGYDIVGPKEGAGFKVDDKYAGNHITPGGKAEMAAVIDADKDKGVVYLDADALHGVQLIINKNGQGIDRQYGLAYKAVPDVKGLFVAEIDLAKLKQKYGLNAGDEIDIMNLEGENDVGAVFVVQ